MKKHHLAPGLENPWTRHWCSRWLWCGVRLLLFLLAWTWLAPRAKGLLPFRGPANRTADDLGSWARGRPLGWPVQQSRYDRTTAVTITTVSIFARIRVNWPRQYDRDLIGSAGLACCSRTRWVPVTDPERATPRSFHAARALHCTRILRPVPPCRRHGSSEILSASTARFRLSREHMHKHSTPGAMFSNGHFFEHLDVHQKRIQLEAKDNTRSLCN